MGGIAASGVLLLVFVYFFPNSPLRRLVERWIERRVDHRFDKELEQYRHQLTLDAEAVRTEHQRLLHNAALVIERRHEVFRELFRLTHIATGAVTHLFGLREEPTFEDYTIDDLRRYLEPLHLPEGVSGPIVAQWNGGRAAALAELGRVRRRLEIIEADRHYAEAWNYYLTTSLYLPDPVSQKAADVFRSLNEVVAIAKFPEGGLMRDAGQHSRDATERLEELRLLLRAELHA